MDYDSGPHTVTFPAAKTLVTFNISITDDDILEENENFTLTINVGSSSLRVGLFCCTAVTIVDNDCKIRNYIINFMHITQWLECRDLYSKML